MKNINKLDLVNINKFKIATAGQSEMLKIYVGKGLQFT